GGEPGPADRRLHRVRRAAAVRPVPDRSHARRVAAARGGRPGDPGPDGLADRAPAADLDSGPPGRITYRGGGRRARSRAARRSPCGPGRVLGQAPRRTGRAGHAGRGRGMSTAQMDQLAQISNYLMGSAFVILSIAFMCHVAEWIAARRRTKVAAAVAAGAPQEVTADHADEPPVADRFVGVAVSLSVLGTILLVGASITRGLATQRAPFGNMYEFGMTGTAIALVVYLVMVWRAKI